MIIFEKIRYKNFLSTGNSFTEVDFIRNKSTLVIGQNGSGKSTMLDALAYALFNKPHRNITKPQLVNSINKKRLLFSLPLPLATCCRTGSTVGALDKSVLALANLALVASSIYLRVSNLTKAWMPVGLPLPTHSSTKSASNSLNLLP